MTKPIKQIEIGYHASNLPEENQFDYLTLSERTASGKFHGKFVDYNKFCETLMQFVIAANALDRYKKLLFYGEDSDKQRFKDIVNGNRDGYSICEKFSHDNESEIQARYILHASLGVMTESGEIAEAIHKALVNSDVTTLDFINLTEESGDVKWYLAMLARSLGNSWDEDERRNIAKLQKRFPEKFTEQGANERDLESERKILETPSSTLLVK